MKYVNQRDYPHWLYVTRTDMEGESREKGRTTTIATSGCGLCSAVMVADRLLAESGFELEDAVQLSYDTRANFRAGTSSTRFFPAFAEKMGFYHEKTKDSAALLRCLRTGGAAIVLVSGNRERYQGVYSGIAQHYIVAVAEERDGRIVILDPADETGKFTLDHRKDKVEVISRGMSLCHMKTLEEESEPFEAPFELFWRK